MEPKWAKGASANAYVTFQVTPNIGTCSWGVADLPTWITVQSISGTAVTLKLANLYKSAGRSAEITVADQKVMVYQEGTGASKWSCSDEYEFDWRGGFTLDGIVVTSGNSSVSWTVSAYSDWLQVVGGCSGTVAANSSGEVTLWLDPNTTGSSRSSWITMGGKWIRITQTSN